MSVNQPFTYTPTHRWTEGTSYYIQFRDGRRVRTIMATRTPNPILWLVGLFTGREVVAYELFIVEQRYTDDLGWHSTGIPYEPRLNGKMDLDWFRRKWAELDARPGVGS